MVNIRASSNFKKRSTTTVVIDENMIVFLDTVCGILFKLHAADLQALDSIETIIIENTAVTHDWIVSLGNLIALRRVMVVVMLALEFDFWHNATTKTDASLHGRIKAVFVEYRKHSWKSKVNKVGMTVWLARASVQSSRKQFMLS